MFANSLQEVVFDIESVSCYILDAKSNKKNFTMADLAYAGNALYDPYRRVALRLEKTGFPHISNSDLIKLFQDTVKSNVRWKVIYYNNEKTDFYLNGIISEWRGKLSPKNTLLKSAVEISNSYTGRFSPRITYSLYNPDLNTFIRTPVSFGSTETVKKSIFLRIYPDFIDSFDEPDPIGTMVDVENLQFTNLFFSKWAFKVGTFYKEVMPSIHEYFGKAIPMSLCKFYYLTVIASIAHLWSGTNYEQAREFQHSLYKRIMRMVPEQDYLKSNIIVYKLT